MATQMIRLTLHDGDPEGLRLAMLAGRSTMVWACPFTQMSRLLARDEADHPGVHFLIGPPPEKSQAAAFDTAIYIGGCDSLANRFVQHYKVNATEWTHAFVQDAIILAGTLGVTLFRPPPPRSGKDGFVPDSGAVGSTSPSPNLAHEAFEFAYVKSRPRALMVTDGAEFLILKESEARATDMAGLPAGSKLRRAAARQSGRLIPTERPDIEKFTHDFPTSSASAAAEMVYGSSASGRDAWRHVATGLIYKDWPAQQAELKVLLS